MKEELKWVYEAKGALERELLEKLKAFEEETGLEIAQIDLQRSRIIGEGTPLRWVLLECKLPM